MRKHKNCLLSKISLKHKLIIFLLLSLIAVMSIVLNHSGDRKKIRHNEKNVHNEVIKSKDTVENKVQNEELKKKTEYAKKLFFNKKYDEAIKIADEVIKKDSNFYEAYNIKGITLCYSNNFEDGMKNIEKSLKINPNFSYGRFNKALAYELYGEYDKALNWYDKALEIEKDVWSYYGKASIYGRRADVENSIKYLKIAIKMCPDVKKEAKNEEDFNPIRNSKEFQELIYNK